LSRKGVLSSSSRGGPTCGSVGSVEELCISPEV
jgi:hypothetical protein